VLLLVLLLLLLLRLAAGAEVGGLAASAATSSLRSVMPSVGTPRARSSSLSCLMVGPLGLAEGGGKVWGKGIAPPPPAAASGAAAAAELAAAVMRAQSGLCVDQCARWQAALQ
jgi:hypothetical protein